MESNDNVSYYSIDDFIDNTTGPQNLRGYSQQPQKSKNSVLIVLLSCVLIVGIAILAIQLINPFSSDPGTVNNPAILSPNNNSDTQGSWANPGNENGGPDTYGNYGPGSDGTGGGILTKHEDGLTWYSTDNGQTWSQTPPNELPSQNDVPDTQEYWSAPGDGNEGPDTYGNYGPGSDGTGGGMLTKHEDGLTWYSTDNGQTWSQTPPEGLDIP